MCSPDVLHTVYYTYAILYTAKKRDKYDRYIKFIIFMALLVKWMVESNLVQSEAVSMQKSVHLKSEKTTNQKLIFEALIIDPTNLNGPRILMSQTYKYVFVFSFFC